MTSISRRTIVKGVVGTAGGLVVARTGFNPHAFAQNTKASLQMGWIANVENRKDKMDIWPLR